MASSIQSIQSSGHALLGTDAIFDPSTISSFNLIETAHLVNSTSHINSTLNTSVCTPLVDQQLQNPLVIFSVICMVIINLVVIFGNLLVILSVFLYSKLRTVTNLFILSLAVADLLLGLTVVPYSLTQTISKAWYFGKIWCMGWLVIDVWLSTASILNLVAISVDRYLAITKPLKYRTMMTAKRAKFLIASAWIVSFLICFPPLVHTGWNKEGSGLIEVNISQKIKHSSRAQSHPSIKESSTLSLNQHSSNSHSPKQTNNIELNRWSNSYLNSHKFFPQSDVSQRNKRDRFTGEVVTSAPLIADPSLIWLSNQALEHITNNLKKKIRTKFKPVPRLIRNKRETTSDPSGLRNQSKYKKLAQNETTRQLKRLRRSEVSNDDKLELECDYQVLQCVLFDSKGYVIYSAVGSFFIPMIIMIFFYWRIYLVAMYTTNAMNRGYISKKSIRKNPNALTGSKNQIDSFNNAVKYGSTNVHSLDTNSDSNLTLTLRIHRGYVKDQQLVANLPNDLNRRGTNRSSYDSSGRNSTSTTFTVRANSTVDTTTAAQLCRRLLPTRLSNRLLSNNDAKQLRKIQHRSVRCLDRTQNIISLASDSPKPRASTTTAAIKRTQSEHCIETNASKGDLNTEENDDEKLNKMKKKEKDKSGNVDKNDDEHKKSQQKLRVSNSEKNIAKLPMNLKSFSFSSDNLLSRKDPKRFTFDLIKPVVQLNSVQTGSQIQLNIVPPQEEFVQSDMREENAAKIINIDESTNDGKMNGYQTSIEINNNSGQKDTNLDELVETNSNSNLIQAQAIQLPTSGSTRLKSSYWSRLSRKRTHLSKAPNQANNNSGRFEKKRFIAETKAAKTVGIIVGCFWLCWFPFFTVYLTRGLCEDKNCIPDIMLTLFTWLGYINSALNPIIYGLFSKDFRRAFKNIVCKCKFSEEAGISTLIRQIHLPNLFEEDMI